MIHHREIEMFTLRSAVAESMVRTWHKMLEAVKGTRGIPLVLGSSQLTVAMGILVTGGCPLCLLSCVLESGVRHRTC